MSQVQIPSIPLNDGRRIPQLGLGVFLVPRTDTERLVGEALELGYRHIDTAAMYQNEAEVGRAITASGVPREEIFVTTKLATGDQERPREAFEESLDRLGLDRVDLFLIHWPLPAVGGALDVWRSFIEIRDSGRASSIGVSNFEIEHLQELLDETGIAPAVDQIELHPLHQRRELTEFCAEHGIAIEAWGPLAQGKSDVFERPEILAAAEAHGVTPAQVVLRWHVQEGRVVFPKTRRRERLVENAGIFGFELSEVEMSAIAGLEARKNFGPNPREYNSREYFRG